MAPPPPDGALSMPRLVASRNQRKQSKSSAAVTSAATVVRSGMTYGQPVKSSSSQFSHASVQEPYSTTWSELGLELGLATKVGVTAS